MANGTYNQAMLSANASLIGLATVHIATVNIDLAKPRQEAEYLRNLAMPDLDTERAHLVKAENGIVDGEKRVMAQAHRLASLRRGGHATEQAELLLGNLQQTLAVWKNHRDLIAQEIAQLEHRATH